MEKISMRAGIEPTTPAVVYRCLHLYAITFGNQGCNKCSVLNTHPNPKP